MPSMRAAPPPPWQPSQCLEHCETALVLPEVIPSVGQWQSYLDPAAIRTAAILCSMLDEFFQPFAMQQSRRFTNFFEKRLAQRNFLRPWSVEELSKLHFSSEDLGTFDPRIEMLLMDMDPAAEVWGILDSRYLYWHGHNRWMMRTPPEVRRLVRVGYSMPSEGISVLSHCITANSPAMTVDRARRIAVELKARLPGIVCFQGFEEEDRSELFGGLVGSCYEPLEASWGAGLLWDRRRWAQEDVESSGGLVVLDLKSRQQEGQYLRVACARPGIADCLEARRAWLRLLSPSWPLVVCGDLSALGGTEGAGLVPGFSELRSAAVDVLGDEVLSRKPPGDEGDEEGVKLWRPGAIYYKNLAVASVLSGHSERYLRSLSHDELTEVFPAGGLPLYASFLTSAS